MSLTTLFRRQAKLAVKDLTIGHSLAEFQSIYSDSIADTSTDESGQFYFLGAWAEQSRPLPKNLTSLANEPVQGIMATFFDDRLVQVGVYFDARADIDVIGQALGTKFMRPGKLWLRRRWRWQSQDAIMELRLNHDVQRTILTLSSRRWLFLMKAKAKAIAISQWQLKVETEAAKVTQNIGDL